MTNNQRSSHSPEHDDAAQWLVRIRSGFATPEDHRRLDEWLREHPAHLKEFEEVSNIWKDVVEAKPLFQADIDQAEAAWVESASRSALEQRVSRWSFARLVPIGALLVIVTGMAFWWEARPPEPVQYQTVRGEQREVTLADGSSIVLNTDTALTVQLSSQTRTIRLEQGEAWFTVAHESARPFQVEVANGVIHDLGTQFIVYKSPLRVEVSVLDGLVDVLVPSSARSDQAVTRLHPGEQVSYGADGRMSEVGPFDRLTTGTWKNGKLIFKAQPLAKVLAEVSRYWEADIRLLDHTLAEEPVTGVFNVRELENCLDVLQTVLPIHIQRVNSALVIVERAPAPSPIPALRP
ncbi:MAG: FecR family protein [Nitrospira sp.]